jgi:tetratricopeptide (TPR) repeat protein
MGLLNKLARRFSSSATVAAGSESGGSAQRVGDVHAGGGGEGIAGEDPSPLDYTCPTLRDVSVKNGKEYAAGPSGAGVESSADRHSLEGVGAEDADFASAGDVERVGDLRSEMDTMSMGSVTDMASELAIEEFEPSAAVQKRDRLSVILADLERETEAARAGGKGMMNSVIKKYNDVAVGCMEGASLDQSMACLLRAEELLRGHGGAETDKGRGGDGQEEEEDDDDLREEDDDPDSSRLRCITYNNLGCLFRRMSMPEKALHYLQRALAIEQRSANPQINELASTHLNLSASYSVLHQDIEALKHGERAIVLLQGQMWPGSSFKEGMEKLLARVQLEHAGVFPPELMRNAHVLSMAYHNVGTQNERLGRIREAQVSFNRACSIGTKILGPSDRMTMTLQMNNRMFLQRNGGIAKSKPSGMVRSKSGISLNGKGSTTAAGSGSKSAKSVMVSGGGLGRSKSSGVKLSSMGKAKK